MATNVARKCSTCRADMQFVGHVDTETGKNLKEGFMGELIMGKFLSGTLRKYRCPEGHTETNKNEDLPAMGFQILDENDSFRNAKELVGYAEIHAKTERALISFKHLVCLAHIAGYDLSSITRKNVEERNNFHSLHIYPGIIDKAKNGLKTLPSNWLDLLSQQIEAQR